MMELSLGIKYTGTLGIIITAKEKGLISSVSEVIDIIQKTNFRISYALIINTLKRSGEL